MVRKILFISLIFLFACKDNNIQIPDGVLLPEKMEAVMVDVQKIEGQQKVMKSFQIHNKALLDSSYAFVYQKHNVTTAELDSSLKFYTKHPSKMAEIWEGVLEKINSQK